jgi:hypothetical protein
MNVIGIGAGGDADSPLSSNIVVADVHDWFERSELPWLPFAK